MNRIAAILILFLLVGGAVAFYFFRPAPQQVVISPSPAPTAKPSFALSGEILSIDGNTIKLLYEVKAAISSDDLPQYDTRIVPFVETTKVVRIAEAPQGGVIEQPATTADLAYGLLITVQWAEKDGPGLFPQKITILP